MSTVDSCYTTVLCKMEREKNRRLENDMFLRDHHVQLGYVSLFVYLNLYIYIFIHI